MTFNHGVPSSILGWVTRLKKLSGCGGIGRRARLRIWCLLRGSSSLFIRTIYSYQINKCGSGSVVERCLAKANVASSNLVSRSTITITRVRDFCGVQWLGKMQKVYQQTTASTRSTITITRERDFCGVQWLGKMQKVYQQTTASTRSTITITRATA